MRQDIQKNARSLAVIYFLTVSDLFSDTWQTCVRQQQAAASVICLFTSVLNYILTSPVIGLRYAFLSP